MSSEVTVHSRRVLDVGCKWTMISWWEWPVDLTFIPIDSIYNPTRVTFYRITVSDTRITTSTINHMMVRYNVPTEKLGKKSRKERMTLSISNLDLPRQSRHVRTAMRITVFVLKAFSRIFLSNTCFNRNEKTFTIHYRIIFLIIMLLFISSLVDSSVLFSLMTYRALMMLMPVGHSRKKESLHQHLWHPCNSFSLTEGSDFSEIFIHPLVNKMMMNPFLHSDH